MLLGSNELQEVAVVSNGYTGQYGRQAGAQVDYSTKSGSNEWHGDALWNWNGTYLNANDFFRNGGGGGTPQARPFENNNQWAVAFGGPIKKDKAFFFFNTEGLRYVFAAGNSQEFVPTPAFQQFVLGNVQANHPASVPFYRKIFNLYNGASSIAAATPANNSCASAKAAVTAPGVNGQCLESFTASAPNGNTEYLLSGRFDYEFSQKDKAFGRFKVDRGRQPTYTDPINPLFNEQSVQPQDEGQLNYTHVFSPRVVNNFIGSVLWYSAQFKPANLGGALAAFPFDLISTDSSLGTLGSGAGFAVPGANAVFPQGRNVTQWQLVDDLSVSRGNHDFKMGVNFRRDDVTDFTASQGEFPVIATSLGAFAQGLVDGSVAQQFSVTGGSQPLAFYSLGLYFQDEYRVNKKLKLTLTLRADRNSSGVCQSNCASLPVVQFDQLSHDANIPYNQMVNAGQHGILRDTEKAVFQPRIGFAWSPFGEKTVFRGGVGLFTDLYPGTILDNYTRNFPSVTSYSLGFTNPVPLSPDEANNPAAAIAGCNGLFQSNFKSGGNLAGYQAVAPNCATPNLADTANSLKNPKYLEWNFEVQHSLGTRTAFTINYVGNHGFDGLVFNPFLNAFDSKGRFGLPAPNVNCPGGITSGIDCRVSSVTQLTNNGRTNYDGVTVSVSERLFHGFTGQFNYTYSHTLDSVSNGGVLPYSINNSILAQLDPNNLSRLNYASSDYDLRHNITASYVYDLPFKSENQFLNKAIEGWTLAGSFFYHTAFPFSVTDNAAAATLAGDNAAGGSGINPAVLAQPTSPVPTTCTSVSTACFSAANFVASNTETGSGTIKRNAFRGPGYFNSDFTLKKAFHVNERIRLQISLNAYNVFNHVNFANPVGNITAANFGLFTTTVTPPTTPYGSFTAAPTDSRIVQLTLKATF